jgi:hypothetical protein
MTLNFTIILYKLIENFHPRLCPSEQAYEAHMKHMNIKFYQN